MIICEGVSKIVDCVSDSNSQTDALSQQHKTRLIKHAHDGSQTSHSLRRHQLACLQQELNSTNCTTSYLVEVGVSGDIVAPFLGVDEGFPLVPGLVHFGVHRLPSGQAVFHDVASLNRASVNCHECNKWTRKCVCLSLSSVRFLSGASPTPVQSLPKCCEPNRTSRAK